MTPSARDSHDSHDEALMARALALASDSIGLTSPNPHAGCVIVLDDEIVGFGAHRQDEHAVMLALRDAADRESSVRGASAYVTLEPCAGREHHVSCADALIDAGIARVVIATDNPDPHLAGAGLFRLRQAGVDTLVGVLAQQARDLNNAFARFVRSHRPFITLKAGLSVDGKLAPDPRTRRRGQLHWITGPAAKADVHRLRHASDAILTGIGTVLADNPLLTDRSGRRRRRRLLRVILDTHLRTPVSARVVLSANDDLLILCGVSASDDRRHALMAAGVRVEHVPADAGQLSLPAVLDVLSGLDVLSVLLECGSALNGSFLRQDLVDQVILFYAPATLGDTAVPFAAGVRSPHDLERSLTRVTRVALDHGASTDTRVTGYLHDPWRIS